MKTQIKSLTDSEFISQFENQTLDKIHFNHIGHLRLSWLYLGTYDVEQAIKKICEGINVYATSLAATDKFNLTITDSIMRIMAKRINLMPKRDWQLFLRDNSDLVDDCFSVLCQYYNKNTLNADLARTTLISPDIRPI